MPRKALYRSKPSKHLTDAASKADVGEKCGPTCELDAGRALLLSRREDVEGAEVAVVTVRRQLDDADGAAVAAGRHQLHVVVLVADAEWQLVRQQQPLFATVPAHLRQGVPRPEGDVAAEQQGALRLSHQASRCYHLSWGGERSTAVWSWCSSEWGKLFFIFDVCVTLGCKMCLRGVAEQQ